MLGASKTINWSEMGFYLQLMVSISIQIAALPCGKLENSSWDFACSN